MSTLRVDNLQASDGLSPAYATSGVAKAWVTYDMASTTIDGSDNVSSLTDSGAGNFLTTITNAMADANYASVGDCSNGVRDRFGYKLGSTKTTTTRNQLGGDWAAAGFTGTDLSNDCNLSFHGDLA